MHHKLMQAMAERETLYTLESQGKGDDITLGGEHSGGKAGRGSENKGLFVAGVSLDDHGHPLHITLTEVPGFTRKAIAGWKDR
ncbi:MAG: hypothetical protein D084_Lepto4C00500G0002 [Leptospirillum sp. Group IV 'UBA BS']|jgi:hypothetical protein|nr:MAG: hypothetical protein D084_Lepto4C00500G0002 [Leptospirillum sp. Group IV 'UBA BS']